MSKIFVFIASIALASCAQIDHHEHMMNQRQQQIDMTNFQNERIREHQELTQQQRQSQLEELNDQRRVQEQMIRDHEQERLERTRENQHHNVHKVFVVPQTPAIIHLQPAVVNIPVSTRHFNVHDDSNYDYRYGVTDMTTGDMKTHKETRRGDEVQGQYTIMDSDGYHRTVNYRANDRVGFDAEVRREPAYPALAYAHNHNGFTNYQGHHNQHNFDDNNQEQWNYYQQVHLIPQPISEATTSVTKVDDQYTTKTTTV